MTAEKGVYCDLAGLRNPSSRIQEVERLVHEFLDGVIPRTEVSRCSTFTTIFLIIFEIYRGIRIPW